MPTLFVFLLKVNIALLLFCAGYYAVLRHLTFYTLNRVYLLTAILFASVYPTINLDSFARQHQQLAAPAQAVVLTLQTPAQIFIAPVTVARPDYWHWAEVIFWLGALFLALRLLVQLYSLYKLYRSSTPGNIQNHDVRIIKGDAAPFSFWKNIYINPLNHNAADLKAILLHEQVHVNQLHTLDILLAELSTIFYWFNPGVWLMKRAVRENIEFITDRKIVNNGIDTKEYQYSLVNVILTSSTQGLANHFNLSAIKKRIMMMNAKRSSKFNLTRYAFLIPALVVLLLVFSVSKAAFVSKSKTALHKLVATISTNHLLHHIISNQPVIKIKKAKQHPADTTQLNKETLPNAITLRPLSTNTDQGKLDEVSIVPPTTQKPTVVNVKTVDWTKPQRITAIKINGKIYRSVNDSAFFGPSVQAQALLIKQASDSIHFGKIIRAKIISVDSNKKAAKTEGITTHEMLANEVEENAKNALRKVVSVTTVPRMPMAKDTYTIVGKKPGENIRVINLIPPTNYTDFTGKLILVDGKEITPEAMKKLSLATIKSITPFRADDNASSGGDFKKVYGEKAKNGVIWITLKKDSGN